MCSLMYTCTFLFNLQQAQSGTLVAVTLNTTEMSIFLTGFTTLQTTGAAIDHTTVALIAICRLTNTKTGLLTKRTVIRLALVHFRNVYLTVKSRGISRLLTRSKTMIFSQGVILISMLLIWFILAKLLYRPEQASFQAGEYHCWQEI